MKIQKYLDMFKQIYSVLPPYSFLCLAEEGIYFYIENELKFIETDVFTKEEVEEFNKINEEFNKQFGAIIKNAIKKSFRLDYFTAIVYDNGEICKYYVPNKFIEE